MPNPSPAPDADRDELMLRAWSTLDARHRRLVWLDLVEQVPRPVIARTLGVHPAAIDHEIGEARTALRRAFAVVDRANAADPRRSDPTGPRSERPT